MNDRHDAAGSCLEVRKLLRAFADDQLGLTDTGTVEGHLLTCRECGDLLGRLLIDDVVNGALPLLTPPVMPPMEWFDAFVHGRSATTPTPWSSVRQALAAGDRDVRNRGRARQQEICRGIDAIAEAAMPAVSETPHPESPSLATLDAVVLSPPDEPSECVPFEVIATPRITEAGAFAVHLSTRMPHYEGHTIVCTLMLPNPPDVSFSGILLAGPDGTSEVRIEEPNVADARARPIAIDAVRVSVIPVG